MNISVKKQKYKHGGWLEVKIHIVFYGDSSYTTVLRQMKFDTVQDLGHFYKFCVNYYIVS
jgi:hypothetical protein